MVPKIFILFKRSKYSSYKLDQSLSNITKVLFSSVHVMENDQVISHKNSSIQYFYEKSTGNFNKIGWKLYEMRRKSCEFARTWELYHLETNSN